MTSDRLTFVVPVCGDSPYLEQCLESLAKQSVRCPVILSTSAPSQHQQRAAGRYGIAVVENPDGGNISADWNFAYGLAPTPFVTIAHQDDIYLEEYAGRCLELAGRFPDFLAVFSNYWELDAGRLRTSSAALLAKRLWLGAFCLRTRLRSAFWKKFLVAFGDPLCTPSAMLNKTAIGHNPFRRGFLSGVDWDLWQRLAERKGAFVYERRPLLVYRIHGHSVTAQAIRRGLRRKEDLSLLKKSFPGAVAHGLAVLYRAVLLLNRSSRRD